MSSNETMYKIHINKIVNRVVFDCILRIFIVLYNTTRMSHLKAI